MIEYYGITPAFPMESQLVGRSLEVIRPKRIYLVRY